jgi:uncharacterized membrane protein YeaQ/YmgE (transglycosylase-associated protein family)
MSFFNKEMNMIWTLIVGLVVGAIAKMLMPGKDPGGIIITMVLGIVGALLAHFVGQGLGWYAEGEPAGIFASIIGAVAVLAIYRTFVTRNPRIHH